MVAKHVTPVNVRIPLGERVSGRCTAVFVTALRGVFIVYKP